MGAAIPGASISEMGEKLNQSTVVSPDKTLPEPVQPPGASFKMLSRRNMRK